MVMMYVAMAVNTLLAMTAHAADWAERMDRVTHLAQQLGVPESYRCPLQNRTVQGQKVDQLKYRQDDDHSLYCFLQPPTRQSTLESQEAALLTLIELEMGVTLNYV